MEGPPMKKVSRVSFLKLRESLIVNNPIIHYSLLLGIFLFAGCGRNETSREKNQGSLILETVHPRYLQIPVPSGGIEVQTNPPVLFWPNSKGTNVSYEIQLSQDSLFLEGDKMQTIRTNMALFNPHRELMNGTWYWHYKTEGEEFLKTNSFVVSDNAVKIVSPSPEFFLKSIPVSHPRVLVQKNEVPELRNLQNTQDAQAIILEAEECLLLPVPSEKEAGATRKMEDPSKQKKMDQDASQNLSSLVYERILALSQAYLLTGKEEFARKATELAMEVSKWDSEGVTQLSDFGDARCMLGMALVYDTFFEQLQENQKKKLLQAISKRAGNFYQSWINNIESKVLSGHVWQHILHYFFQTAVALKWEIPVADDWLKYAYELFLAREPVLGGFDGGWMEGVSYFRMNMETFVDIPLIIREFTGFDFINTNPWYNKNIEWMMFHIPPGSRADGFSDNTEEVSTPGPEYIAWADEMAKLTGNQLAAWYAKECRKYENPDLSKVAQLRWIRLTKTKNMALPEIPSKLDFPLGMVFRDVGLASFHSNPENRNQDLMVAFKSSPYGSYGHLLCDQNTFNILFGGERIFYRTGYKVTMDDPHRTEWYRTTKSQNGILINGEGQTYSSDAFGWISRFLRGEEAGYVRGDATNAWKDDETGDNNGIKKVIRHLIFLKPDIVVLYDDLEADDEKQWSWLIHSFKPLKIEPENGVFIATSGKVTGTGKIYSSGEVHWTVSDTFDVPAVNWRKSLNDRGELKSYDTPQWHLRVVSRQKNKAIRFLTILKISSLAEFAKEVEDSKCDEHGNVNVTVDDWNITASLNTVDLPELTITKINGTTALSTNGGEIILNGKKYGGKAENSSFLVEQKSGIMQVTEANDEMPQRMKNVWLFNQQYKNSKSKNLER